ncbi:MAG: hypothetical protein ACJ77A_18100 [Actinomycetota bacterium]
MKDHPSTHRSGRGRFVRTSRAAALIAGILAVAALAAPPASASGLRSERAGTSLHIFYRSPVLVSPGERVRIPVDVVCTIGERACPASARLSLVGATSRSRAADAVTGLEFDVSRAADRAGPAGRVDFRLSAVAAGGLASALPGGRDTLHLYVAPRMAAVHMPSVPFGRYRHGRQVLFLPWGSAPTAAGLSPGDEAATLGPSAFAIAPDGRIDVADVFHQRLLRFLGNRLVGGIRLPMSPQTDLAVGRDGQTFLASDFVAGQRRTGFTMVDRAGRIESSVLEPGGILDAVGTDGSAGFVHVLPLDGWVGFPGPASIGGVRTGLPLPDGSLMLRSVVGRTVRLGVASGSGVGNAVELRSSRSLGDLTFAAPDGAGGYVAVVRVVSAQADQYEVVHVGRDRSVTAFAVASHQFAQTMPGSKFRLGPDGALYQMTTSPDGVRIVRYAMGGAR